MNDIVEFEIPQEMKDLIEEEENDNFENYRKNIVAKIAYLIGVPEEKLACVRRNIRI